jgi:cob(I)alamin adenosyltransferase
MTPRTLIFTGDGKGKTTAALGMVLRAVGHGQRVMIVQFLKSNNVSGELSACTLLPLVELVQIGCGFVPSPDHPDYARHGMVAHQALEFARTTIASGHHELIVLDEICGAIGCGLIDMQAVIEMIDRPGRKSTIVLTGRGAPPELIELADTVTEMRAIKHGYAVGYPAQKGVEF